MRVGHSEGLTRGSGSQAEVGRRRNVGAVTEAAILDAAVREFAQMGYDQVSLRTVSRHVGITPPTIYLYFPDKRSLYRAACLHCFGRVADAILSNATGGSTPGEKLERFVRVLVATLIDDPDASMLFERELISNNKEDLAAAYEGAFQQPFGLLVNILEELTGRQNDTLSALTIFSITLGLIQFSTFISLVRVNDVDYTWSADQLSAHILMVAKQGILNDVSTR